MSRKNNPRAGLRSSLANAAFAVEEHVVWGGSDAARSLADAVRWPFERIAWAIERGLIWPLQERTGWRGSLRVLGIAALALLAVGAGVLGLLWASGSGTSARQAQAPRPIAAPVVAQPPQEKLAPAAPVLHGASPDFTPETGIGDARATAEDAAAEPATHTPTATTDNAAGATTSSSAATNGAVAGPAAIKVGRRFADAFVLYETGQSDNKVRAAFAATATPRLAHALLQRPPRLPANVKVPKARVLNVVPGPHHGDTYTLSVSLLRVGVTSELRLDVEQDKDGNWQVTDVLG